MRLSRIFGLSATVLLLGGLLFLMLSPPQKGSPDLRDKEISRQNAPPDRQRQVPENDLPGVAGNESEDQDRLLSPPDPRLRMDLEALREKLRQKPDRETALRLLQEFMAKVLAMDPDPVAATLLEFLRSGEDQGTGLDFVVGEAGLEEWPTLRAFLLDLLGKIDLGMASEYALSAVIPAESSTVEYAVALRIFWLNGGAEQATPELANAWSRLFRKADWAEHPDEAWLESLDFVVRMPSLLFVFIPEASDWLAHPGVSAGKADAAQLALERLVRNHPVETLGTLLKNPDWFSQGRGPVIRASLFARVDLSNASQAEILHRYLLSLDPANNEAKAFAKAFPYRKFSVSPGLAGFPNLQTPEEIRTSNQAAAEFFRQAASAGTYPKIQKQITQIQARLNELNHAN